MQAFSSFYDIIITRASSDDLESELLHWSKQFKIDQSSISRYEHQLIGKLMHAVRTCKIPAIYAHEVLLNYILNAPFEISSAIYAMTHLCTLLSQRNVNRDLEVLTEFQEIKAAMSTTPLIDYQTESIHFSQKYKDHDQTPEVHLKSA